MPKKNRLVYSVGPKGATSHREDAPSAEPRASLPPQQQRPRVRRERAGRKGKTVTVAEPLVLTRDDAGALLAELKRACGTGGTLKSSTTKDGAACFSLEVQGDHVERVVDELARRGHDAKRSGG